MFGHGDDCLPLFHIVHKNIFLHYLLQFKAQCAHTLLARSRLAWAAAGAAGVRD